MIYVIGSLRNPAVLDVSAAMRDKGFEVFDSWFAAGPEADDYWKAYSLDRGQSYKEALADYAAQHVFNFDKKYLTIADTVVLVLPAGKSGHLELGWALGQGKRGYILLDDPDRWDVMYNFATDVFYTVEDLVVAL